MKRRDLIQKLLEGGTLDDEVQIEIITRNSMGSLHGVQRVGISYVFTSRPAIQVEAEQLNHAVMEAC